jgi:AAA domain-containing protein/primase-like protein
MSGAAMNKNVSPDEIQASAPESPPVPILNISNMITVYQAEGKMLNKGYTREGDGVKSFPGTMTREIRVHLRYATNIEELLKALQWSEARTDTCASWSTPRPDLDLSGPIGRAGNLIAGSKAWLPIDLDHLPMVPEQGVDICDLAALDEIVAPLLPKSFHGVDRIIQATPSHGIEGKGVRLRYWFMLSRPIVKREVLELLSGGDLTIGRADKDTLPNIDTSLYDNGKYIYTGPPQLAGLADPMEGAERLLLIKGNQREVSVPQYPRPQTPIPALNANRMDRASVDSAELERVKCALQHLFDEGMIIGDGTYPSWREVAFALLSGFEEDLAHGLFASVSPDLAGKDQKCWTNFVKRHQTRSATESKIGLGTLFKMAGDAGWQDPYPELNTNINNRPLGEMFLNELPTKAETLPSRDGREGLPGGVPDIEAWGPEIFPHIDPVIEFLIDGTFAMGEVSLLGAEGGLGKSTLLTDLGITVATGVARSVHNLPGLTHGVEWLPPAPTALGALVQTFGNVVILAAEDSRLVAQARFFRLDPVGSWRKSPHKLRFVPLPSAGGAQAIVNEKLEVTDWYWNIHKQIVNLKPKLIIVDPLAGFISAEYNADPRGSTKIMDLLSALADDTGAAVIVSHHMRKPSGNSAAGQGRYDLRGSGALVDRARGVFTMSEPEEKMRREIMGKLDLPDEEHAVAIGQVVKSNGLADRNVRVFVRHPTVGLLLPVSQHLRKQEPQKVDLEAALIEGVANAARKGAPMTKTGEKGVYCRRCEMLPVLKNIPRTKMEQLVDTALASGKLVELDRRYGRHRLDVPLARGEGVQASGQPAE